MFFNRRHLLTREQFWNGMEHVIKILRELIMKQTELAVEVREQTVHIVKIGTETRTLLEKIAALEEAINNQENVSEELQTAWGELKIQAQVVDDEVPDGEQLKALAEKAAAGPELHPAKPGPDLASVNPGAQTNEEKAHGAGPGSLPDLKKAKAAGELQPSGVIGAGGTTTTSEDALDATDQHTEGVTPEQAAAIERQAGINLANAGQPLPDLATAAAREGFDSVVHRRSEQPLP